jgi:hypothetical protein
MCTDLDASEECRSKQLPTIVLACKSDQQRLIEPDRALELLQQYDVGLVEVTAAQDAGKAKMRQSFDWLVKAILRSWRECSNLLLRTSSDDLLPRITKCRC